MIDPLDKGLCAQPAWRLKRMPAESENQSFLELYDIAKKEKVASAPLAEIRFIPRTGERIFIPLKGAGDWNSFTVVAVEYFLGYEQPGGEPTRTISSGFGRVTLYVEESK
jgi:hypothetical protein